MTRVLRSYVQDRWIEGSGERARLLNPTTEEVLAETGAGGIDFAAALSHARTKGIPALQEMTFAGRGKLLAAISSAIHAHRDELIDLAIANGGNTRGDAKFDIDGCTGTLMFYASLGESLGAKRVLVDGEQAQLARNPRMIGQHFRIPRAGVAVHINAFNFPAWGFGEKAAVALLAGMPVITKPATATALVAARLFEILVEKQVLPAGALSFLAGGTGDLLDHLSGQDVLAFTGSSDTGLKLRSRERLLREGVRVNVEADSLNSAVLGPDVEPGSPAYDLFIRETARDVTQKAGQKCTAIRRVFVPAERLATVKEDWVAEISRTAVGDPSLNEVRMGPLATANQLRDVRAGIERLKGCAIPFHGDGGRGKLTGVSGEKGYFVSPTLFVAPSPEAATAVHQHEVFGPVATLMPYDGSATQAVAFVRLGNGGLVSSVYTDDQEFAGAMLFGIAPYHGRVHLGSEKIAEHSPGPGTVLPQMIHGGPGRAGAGEELGGLRGLSFYMQRTAVQGLKPMIERILNPGGGGENVK